MKKSEDHLLVKNLFDADFGAKGPIIHASKKTSNNSISQ